MPGTRASIAGEPAPTGVSWRQGTANSQKSSGTCALPIQRWRLPSAYSPLALQPWARGRRRTVTGEIEVLVRVERAVAGVEQRLQRFASAQSGRQPDGQDRPKSQHDEQCNSGLRKSAIGGRKDAL